MKQIYYFWFTFCYKDQLVKYTVWNDTFKISKVISKQFFVKIINILLIVSHRKVYLVFKAIEGPTIKDNTGLYLKVKSELYSVWRKKIFVI